MLNCIDNTMAIIQTWQKILKAKFKIYYFTVTLFLLNSELVTIIYYQNKTKTKQRVGKPKHKPNTVEK